MMFTLAVLAILVGLLFLGKFFYDKKKAEEQKDFVVLGATMFLIWLFPGAALLIIGLVLIFLLM